jgi:hypothetical protein
LFFSLIEQDHAEYEIAPLPDPWQSFGNIISEVGHVAGRPFQTAFHP